MHKLKIQFDSGWFCTGTLACVPYNWMCSVGDTQRFQPNPAFCAFPSPCIVFCRRMKPSEAPDREASWARFKAKSSGSSSLKDSKGRNEAPKGPKGPKPSISSGKTKCNGNFSRGIRMHSNNKRWCPTWRHLCHDLPHCSDEKIIRSIPKEPSCRAIASCLIPCLPVNAVTASWLRSQRQPSKQNSFKLTLLVGDFAR